jgi:hypothetical protein
VIGARKKPPNNCRIEVRGKGMDLEKRERMRVCDHSQLASDSILPKHAKKHVMILNNSA